MPLEQEKALNIALNKVSSDWDEDKLARLLDELVDSPDIDVALTGFDPPEITDLLDDLLSEGAQSEHFDIEAELPVFTRSWYMWSHELCFLGWVRGNKPRRAERRALPTVWNINIPSAATNRPDHSTPTATCSLMKLPRPSATCRAWRPLSCA